MFLSIPEDQMAVITRWGKYRKSLLPGLNWVSPLDKFQLVYTGESVVQVPRYETFTKDEVAVLISAVAYIKVVDPQKAVYKVTDYKLAVENLIQIKLGLVAGEMEHSSVLCSRSKIKEEVERRALNDAARWGVALLAAEIKEIITLELALEQRRVAAMVNLSNSANSKVVFMPAEGMRALPTRATIADTAVGQIKLQTKTTPNALESVSLGVAA